MISCKGLARNLLVAFSLLACLLIGACGTISWGTGYGVYICHVRSDHLAFSSNWLSFFAGRLCFSREFHILSTPTPLGSMWEARTYEVTGTDSWTHEIDIEPGSVEFFGFEFQSLLSPRQVPITQVYIPCIPLALLAAIPALYVGIGALYGRSRSRFPVLVPSQRAGR